MVVIIRINDDNYATKDCFIAEDVNKGIDFICKEADCTPEELKEFEEHALSPHCRVWDFQDGLIYRMHLKPETV